MMGSQNFQPINFSGMKDKGDERSPLVGGLFLFLIFSFTFIFLYFLYACTRRSQAQAITAANFSTSSQNQAPARARSPKGLDPDIIGSLPIVSYESNVMNRASQEAECVICLSMFQEGDKIMVMPRCHHGFHSECVDIWLRNRSSCPLCRASILQVDSSVDPKIP